MDFLNRKLRDFRSFYFYKTDNDKKEEITKVQGYFHIIYKILSWHDAALTLSCFLVMNFVFWLVIQLELRIFGIIFLLILALFIGDSCLEQQTKFAGDLTHLDVMDTIRNDIMDIYSTLKALRKDNPSSFCIGMSLIFLTLSFVARNLSGHVIFYLFLLAVFFIPLAISVVPPEMLDLVKQFFKSLGSERGVLAEDELIPYIFDKDFSERDPDLDSLLTDKTADSVTNSLISGLNGMPSYLDAEDKESLEEEDFIPQKSGAVSFTPGDISSDSDSDHKGIRFESGHFNGDSSSEEEIYAKNLNFSNVESNDSIDPNLISVAKISDNLIKVGNFIKMAVSTPVRKDSSSDSEFEIINSEDVQ